MVGNTRKIYSSMVGKTRKTYTSIVGKTRKHIGQWLAIHVKYIVQWLARHEKHIHHFFGEAGLNDSRNIEDSLAWGVASIRLTGVEVGCTEVLLRGTRSGLWQQTRSYTEVSRPQWLSG